MFFKNMAKSWVLNKAKTMSHIENFSNQDLGACLRPYNDTMPNEAYKLHQFYEQNQVKYAYKLLC